MKKSRIILSKRRIIQAAVGLGLYLAISKFGLPLVYVLGGGAVTGVILGKVFCRWMCPMGFIMELLMGGEKKGAEASQMYQYHKVGCPIAWVGGYFNKISPFKIRRDDSSCNSCGLCDKNCYISNFDKDFSLYKADKRISGDSFSCSRCLECVGTCPTGSLRFGLKKRSDRS